MWKCQIEHDAAKEAKEKRVVFSGEEISMPHPLGFHRSSGLPPIRSWSFSSTTPFRHRANKISIGESAGVTRRKRTVQARPVRLAFI